MCRFEAAKRFVSLFLGLRRLSSRTSHAVDRIDIANIMIHLNRFSRVGVRMQRCRQGISYHQHYQPGRPRANAPSIIELMQINVFTGSSHPELASLILERLSLPPAPAVLKRFSNAEISVEIGASVRDMDVFIIQSGSSTVNDHVMELLIMISACRAASARRITAVLPYFPYNKQSKRKKARGAITAKLLANMLQVSGVDHIITLDLHSSHIQGFFNKPVDNLTGEPAIAKYLKERFPTLATQGIIICKNAGGAKLVTSMSDKLKIDFALIHRERYHVHELADDETIETRLTLVGDVQDKICFLYDDSIDGAHSFLDSCAHLKKCNAAQVFLVASHGILSGNSLTELEQSTDVDGIIVTNSYPIPKEKRALSTKLEIIG